MVNMIDPLDPNQGDFGKYFETMTVADVMRWLQVSRATVKVWVKKGLIPAPVRVGKGLRWDKGLMREWLEMKCVMAYPQADKLSTAPSVSVPAVSENEGEWPV